MAKHGSAALLQSSAATQQLENVVMGLGAVIEGASLGGSEDLKKLTSMLQTHQDAEDGNEDQDSGAQGVSQKPYEGQSASIIEVLEDLRDKAEGQLREIRTAETKARAAPSSRSWRTYGTRLKDNCARFVQPRRRRERLHHRGLGGLTGQG